MWQDDKICILNHIWQ